MKKNLKILVTNDDGIRSPGIEMLVAIAKEMGDVYVVAPNKGQSGMSHATTIEMPISFRKIEHHKGSFLEWECSGTPVDCVKLAFNKLFSFEKPDICLSGINHGSNASIKVLYSGTMAAALEACMMGVPSIGFSFCNHVWKTDLSIFKKDIRRIIEYVLVKKEKLKQEICLNVNIPDPSKVGEIKGIRICHPSNTYWESNVIEQLNPYKTSYYWISGRLKKRKKERDLLFNENQHSFLKDLDALDKGYISIVPLYFDLTNYQLTKELKEEEGLEIDF